MAARCQDGWRCATSSARMALGIEVHRQIHAGDDLLVTHSWAPTRTPRITAVGGMRCGSRFRSSIFLGSVSVSISFSGRSDALDACAISIMLTPHGQVIAGASDVLRAHQRPCRIRRASPQGQRFSEYCVPLAILALEEIGKAGMIASRAVVGDAREMGLGVRTGVHRHLCSNLSTTLVSSSAPATELIRRQAAESEIIESEEPSR